MSRRNRKLRAHVLSRDGWRCKMMRDGRVCGRPAKQANHRRRQRDGGPETLSNLEASCEECNATDGGLARFEATPPPAALTAVQASIVAALDAAGLRADAGRRAAVRALDALALVRKYRSADIDTACRWRRRRGPLRRESGSAGDSIGPRDRW